ncbi:hypothetical protein ELH62_15325 [Rhizobium ruizarguesonis]|uniref:hypothetical protein n=1 Tax=Rhizobium ruizarguesonis TaxID=2081791 RepID=UPI0010300EE6|nr:hypothetical protein [Rhizobium ruizarguesonis]TBA43657.1 hypothetical protein ELH62_15325 [Rhizobium ruizarguesonis]
MRLRAIAVALACLACSAPAFAFTGAELIQGDRSFGVGYVFGVVEYQTGVLDRDNPNFMKVRNCVVGAKMNAETLYDVAVQYFHTHPKTMTEPAYGGIIKAIKEMCE